ncbi:hypothetical protein E1B28_013512 [Marasmius oreades]|uniref:Uncharacterized protein n=1 Tax=Marasmius oreades TaxID=181124 RepID=A0A9P7UMA0_9AGAR|nr:uncharacterized protein E1B28_013512 [Marasmius oreades]KAG7087557.1 hypothetical protein E1B28_013512 [Marasmius oreades]
MKSLTLVPLFVASLASTALAASSCVAFDSNFNLLAFNYGGKDYNAGTQDSWGSGTPTEITTSGRPKFDTDGVTCYLAQFYNAVYVLNADKSNPSSVYIFDAASNSWSTQSVNAGGPDMSSAVSILDHDTNVFYTMSSAKLWSLDMDPLKAKASSDAVTWNAVGTPTSFKADGYQPVMGLAQNHIHFLNTAGAGKADIFVIHFSYWQPETQTYSGPEFPAQHGQVASIFQSEGVQQEFAFFPDDGSGTFVINVENNSTRSLPGPSVKDAAATYAASITALVSSSSQSGIQYLPYSQNGDNSGAKWTKVEKLANLTPPPSSGNGNGNTTGTGGKSTGTNTAPGSKSTGNSSTGGNNNNNGGMKVGKGATAGMFGALLLGSLGVLLI